VSDPTVGFSGPTPQIGCGRRQSAIQFYTAAFGADQLCANQASDGRITHCELLVFGGRCSLSTISTPTRSAHDTPGRYYGAADLSCTGRDRVYANAIGAGATSLAEPNDAFWGDRYAMICDPSGHVWSFGSATRPHHR